MTKALLFTVLGAGYGMIMFIMLEPVWRRLTNPERKLHRALSIVAAYGDSLIKCPRCESDRVTTVVLGEKVDILGVSSMDILGVCAECNCRGIFEADKYQTAAIMVRRELDRAALLEAPQAPDDISALFE